MQPHFCHCEDGPSHTPHLRVIPSDLADVLLLEAFHTDAFEPGCQRRCSTTGFFHRPSGTIGNIVMMKLTGWGEWRGLDIVNMLLISFRGEPCVCVCKCLHVMVRMRSPVGVMSGCIIGYCWVEGHAGLSADGRLIFFTFYQQEARATCLMLV